MKIAISAGHGLYVRGASGLIDEVDEARRVVIKVVSDLAVIGASAVAFFDYTSRTQANNLKTITDWHNKQVRDLDVSIHFDDSEGTVIDPIGSSVLYISSAGKAVGQPVLESLVANGFKDRGMSYRPNLYFLKNTHKPAILIEVCFVNSRADVVLYRSKFDAICKGIANALVGKLPAPVPGPVPPGGFHVIGKCSIFGGPDDTGVASDEGLAFISKISDAYQLFLPYQPVGTTGLARRLNPAVHYVACRWDYNKTPRGELLSGMALVSANGIKLRAYPADWGPNENTGRVADLSPKLALDLGVETGDTVEVIFPYNDGVA